MTFRSPSKWKYRWRGGGGECNFSLTILKENCLLLQLPINFSYTVDARTTKPICMIPLYVQMLATYIWKFWIDSDFSDFTQKCNFSVIYSWNWLKFLSVLEGGGSYTSYIKRVLSCDFQISPKWKYWWRGRRMQFLIDNFERNLFVTSVTHQLLSYYLKLLGWIAGKHMQHISNGFCHITFSSHSRWILMVGRIYIWLIFFKEIWSILQLPINFFYTFDARFVKHAFMIHLFLFLNL